MSIRSEHRVEILDYSGIIHLYRDNELTGYWYPIPQDGRWRVFGKTAADAVDCVIAMSQRSCAA